MQYHAIPCRLCRMCWIWRLVKCWRSVSLPCGQYMAIFSTARCSSSRNSLRGITHSPITHSTFWWRCYLQLWWYFFYIIHPSIKNTIWKSSLMFLTKFLQSLSKQWHSTSGWPKPVQSSWVMTQNHVLKARMLWSSTVAINAPWESVSSHLVVVK